MILKFFRLFKLISFPRVRFGIFNGSNTYEEFKFLLKLLFNNDLFLNQFTSIKLLEETFKNYFRSNYVKSFAQGRMALFVLLKKIGIKKGDEIIIPAFTCVAVPNVIIYAGARPIYVDISIEDFNINPNLIKNKITKKTKAIIIQHTFGLPCNIKLIKKIAKKYNLITIEDCTHSLGSNYKKHLTGTLSDAAFFSFDNTKIINAHSGGILIINQMNIIKSKKFSINNKSLSNFFLKKQILTHLLEYILFSKYFMWIGKFIMTLLDYSQILFLIKNENKLSKPKNFPLPLNPAFATLILNQILRLKKNLKHRQGISQLLNKKIKWYNFSDNDIYSYSWLRYSFLVRNRDFFIKKFNKHFDLDIWYQSVVHGREKNLYEVFYQIGSCPVAEFVTKTIVNIPTHEKIPTLYINNVINKNWHWLKKNIYYKKKVF
jgi:perosamine synthetase